MKNLWQHKIWLSGKSKLSTKLLDGTQESWLVVICGTNLEKMSGCMKGIHQLFVEEVQQIVWVLILVAFEIKYRYKWWSFPYKSSESTFIFTSATWSFSLSMPFLNFDFLASMCTANLALVIAPKYAFLSKWSIVNSFECSFLGQFYPFTLQICPNLPCLIISLVITDSNRFWFFIKCVASLPGSSYFFHSFLILIFL